MVNKLRHVGLVVIDLKRSLFFWNKILGFKLLKKAIEKGSEIDRILGFKKTRIETNKLVDENKNIIELIYFLNPKTKKRKIFTNSNGPTHIALTVENLNFLYKKMKKNKIKFMTKPIMSKDKKVLVTYCHSPEGAFVELVEEIK